MNKNIEWPESFDIIILEFLAKDSFLLVDLHKSLNITDSSNMNETHQNLRQKLRKTLNKLCKATHIKVKVQSTYRFYKMQ